jgi:hypothetical protein
MKPGIIITNVGELKTGLTYFRCDLREGKAVTATKIFLVKDAIEAFVHAYGHFNADVGWISGNAASRTLAKKFKVVYRQRVPGGGRPSTGVKGVTIWMTQGGIDEMKRQLRKIKPKRSQGQHFETLLSQNAPNVP